MVVLRLAVLGSTLRKGCPEISASGFNSSRPACRMTVQSYRLTEFAVKIYVTIGDKKQYRCSDSLYTESV